MRYDFDKRIDRTGTNALALEGHNAYLFGETNQPGQNHDLIPLWVADMQFECAPALLNPMQERLDHGIFGYTENFDDALFKAFQAWSSKRYDWEPPSDDLHTSLGVIPALFSLVEFLCQPGERALTLSPAYGFFAKAAQAKGVQLVTTPLQRYDDQYFIDFEDLARHLADPLVSIFFLCHPHNPTGRIWTEEELLQIASMCRTHGVKVVSDEVHCDLLRVGNKHRPLAQICPEDDNIITCMAPSKSFNCAGLMIAIIVFQNQQLKDAWRNYNYPFVNPFGLVAATGAYSDGSAWLDQLREYLDGNFELLKDTLERRLPEARFFIPAATYLAWVDVSPYCGTQYNMTKYLLSEAGVIVEGGEMFIDNAEGMIRLNVACPRQVLIEAISRICDAVDHFYPQRN